MAQASLNALINKQQNRFMRIPGMAEITSEIKTHLTKVRGFRDDYYSTCVNTVNKKEISTKRCVDLHTKYRENILKRDNLFKRQLQLYESMIALMAGSAPTSSSIAGSTSNKRRTRRANKHNGGKRRKTRRYSKKNK